MSIIRTTATTTSQFPKTRPISPEETIRQKPSPSLKRPFKILSRPKASRKSKPPKTTSLTIKVALTVPNLIAPGLGTVAIAPTLGDNAREIAVVAGKAAEIIISGAMQKALQSIISGKSRTAEDPRRGGGAAQGRGGNGKGQASSSPDHLKRGKARRGAGGCTVIGWSRGGSE
jgi:hypothetical protein